MIAKANPNAIPERQFVNPKTNDDAMHNLTSAPPTLLFDILKLTLYDYQPQMKEAQKLSLIPLD